MAEPFDVQNLVQGLTLMISWTSGVSWFHAAIPIYSMLCEIGSMRRSQLIFAIPVSFQFLEEKPRYTCHLSSIDLSSCRKFTSTGLRHLTSLCGPSLRHVNISFTKVTYLDLDPGISLLNNVTNVDLFFHSMLWDIPG